ncbi:hypothetical protein [Streptomyces sp. NPDC059564]|uniref:hypothetical protein n=1 Tax=Streptomyces sp. NPDC059564 TaxID=3346865 RepID=UPI0036B6A923
MTIKSTPEAFTFGGDTHHVSREEIEAAAERLVPAHSATPLPYSWYALVGGGLFYVGALIKQVTGVEPSVKTARVVLHSLGFPVMAYAWNEEFIQAGHPANVNGYPSHGS